jgi:recombination protein RecT
MAENNALALTSNDKLRTIMRTPEIAERFIEVLGKSNAPAYITSVLLAVASSDKLQKCSPASIITSAMRAATLRLSCDPSTKQAHLVPFGNKATLVVGHKGYYDMANRTGKYRYLNDFRVFEGQEVVEDQLRGTIELRGQRTSQKVIGYGFYFEMVNGLKKVLYMTVEEIREHGAKYSKTYNFSDSLWKTNFEAMARKTVTRLCLSRYGYLDPTDALTLGAVDEAELDDNDLMQIQAPPRQRRSYSQNMRDLGFEPDEPEPTHRANVDMSTGELLEPIEGKFELEEARDAEDEEENGLDDPNATDAPADPYADLKELAATDAATAFWKLQTRIGWNRNEAQAIVKECKADMTKAFAALLKNAPPAMI